MDWTEVNITVAAADTDRAAAIAHMVVPYGLYIEDYSDLEEGARIIAHADAKSGLIDESLLARDRTRAVIHLYINPDENPAEAIAFLRERLSEAGVAHEVLSAAVAEDDWANNWKQYFKPLPIGEKILICPTWEEMPEADGRALLRIDPGMAFGTGGHETTRLVLEAMEEHIRGGERVLDVGCGSGILSVAALLLGAGSVTGIDIDAMAVRTAVENGALNGMKPPAYDMRRGDLAADAGGTYDLVLANIVADAIIALSADVPRFLKPGGAYIVSGIIDTREQDVRDAVAACGFAVAGRRELNGWLCLVLNHA